MTRLMCRRRCQCAQCGFTLIDLLVAIVCLACATQGFLGCRTRNTGTSNRVKCASNLRQIGQAILLYSNDTRGAYPRARMSAGPQRLPIWGTAAPSTQPFKEDGPAQHDVT